MNTTKTAIIALVICFISLTTVNLIDQTKKGGILGLTITNPIPTPTPTQTVYPTTAIRPTNTPTPTSNIPKKCQSDFDCDYRGGEMCINNICVIARPFPTTYLTPTPVTIGQSVPCSVIMAFIQNDCLEKPSSCIKLLETIRPFCPTAIIPTPPVSIMPTPRVSAMPTPQVSIMPTPTPASISCDKIKLQKYNVRGNCGADNYHYLDIECTDGWQETMGGPTSCKPLSLWKAYASNVCANRPITCR
ncbi:MAG: hypothetical protein WCV93_01950 [Candidatus Shapirobacteria bacterium]|jgi:hypothetical protein